MTDATIKTQPRTIRLKGVGERSEKPAGGTITPGMLLRQNSSDQFIAHNSSADDAPAIFALENELFGKGIDDNYVSGDLVQAEHFKPGNWVLALLPANASAVVKGDYLTSNGDGTLVKATQAEDYANVIAKAEEAVDNSAVSAVARIMVSII